MNRRLPTALSQLPARRRNPSERSTSAARELELRALALSQITTHLQVVKEEREMLAEVAGGLLVCFDSARLCEVFLCDEVSRDLYPVFDRELGDALLTGLCSRIEAAPPELRGCPFGPQLIPY